ncbi:MAG: RluA family pseudouridine synthase [Synergistales bacterium]|nr:RluA family pseudouridine synthase [Synergistales bacterium]
MGLTVGRKDKTKRLDVVVAEKLEISRSRAGRLIRNGNVHTSPAFPVKPSLKCPSGTRVTVEFPLLSEFQLEAEEVPFQVVYEDEDCVVVDKPAGVVVHPAPGNWHGTLVQGLLHRFPDLKDWGNLRRPGLVHRLDAGTSGLLVIARNQYAQEELGQAFRLRQVEKHYLALAWKRVQWREKTVALPLGRDPHNRIRMTVISSGKAAKTGFQLLRYAGKTSLLQCRLHTGRTHQIRVHCAAQGHPLVGDRLYGPEFPRLLDFERLFLHAWKLGFRHPRTNRFLQFRSPLPPELIERLQAF